MVPPLPVYLETLALGNIPLAFMCRIHLLQVTSRAFFVVMIGRLVLKNRLGVLDWQNDTDIPSGN